MSPASFLYKLAVDEYRGPVCWIPKVLLWILSLAYGLFIRGASFLRSRRKFRAPCQVISIGNITLGGTGKTPLVSLTAAYLRSKGRRVAVVTRGYLGHKTQDARRMTQDVHRLKSVAVGGSGLPRWRSVAGCKADEPEMLQRQLQDIPVIVDADRVRGIQKAVSEFNADTVILDDGFQQWHIQKDLEIAVIDAKNPFGNRHMIPRGILREPPASLRRADVFVLTKTDAVQDPSAVTRVLNRINPAALIARARHQLIRFYRLGRENEDVTLESIKSKAVLLVAGIADPEYFARCARGAGINISGCLWFGDHHVYTEADNSQIQEKIKTCAAGCVLTTEKDAVKLEYLLADRAHADFLVMSVTINLTGNEQKYYERLGRLYTF